MDVTAKRGAMKFSKEMYPKVALIKSAYSFTDKAYVHLDADEKYYYATVEAKPGELAVTEGDFINEMLCQCARHEVYRQTRALRELLVARALASTVVEEPSIKDSLAVEDVDVDEALASDILSDWFAGNESD